MPETRTRETPRSAAQQTAEKVRDGVLRNDRATRSLGMDVLAIAPGAATLAMRVRDDMLNGHDICHGGFIATLADWPSPSPATRTTS